MPGGHLADVFVRSLSWACPMCMADKSNLLFEAHNVRHDFWQLKAQEVHSLCVARSCPCIPPLLRQ